MKKSIKITLALALVVAFAFCCLGGCAKKSTKIIVLSDTFAAEQYGIGYRNTDIALGLKIQEAFDALVADGTAAKVSQQWLGADLVLKDQPFLEENSAPADDASWTKIQERGYFVLGLDASFPPMGFVNEKNEIIGFDIDLAKAVAKNLGVEVKLQPIDWSAKELELNNGNIDCIWNGMTITDERLASMYFTKPYLSNDQIILVSDHSDIVTKADLKDKIVAAQSGSSGLEAVESDTATRATFKELVTYDEYTAAYQDLKVGRVDALVIDSIVGYYLIATDAA
ncbi:MAG: transporter substrate-binding domain-containing protein [Clostridia bacterium]